MRALAAALTGLVASTLPMLLVGALGVQLKRDLSFDDVSLGLAITSSRSMLQNRAGNTVLGRLLLFNPRPPRMPSKPSNYQIYRH